MLVTFRLSSLGFGGTERVFLSVADYLSSACGCSVDFVVDRMNGQETEQIAIAKGHNVVGLDVPRTWKAILPFARYLRTRRPHVVISAYTETNAAALMASFLDRFRTPTIVTEHASLDEHWACRPRAKRLLLEFVVRYVYKLSDRVMCVSQGMAEQVAKRLNHRHICHIHNPVRFAERTRSRAEARSRLGVVPDVRMILAVGRVAAQKNYLMLLRALAELSGTGKTCLYIVGGVYEADEKARLDEFIADRDLGERVIFVGFTHEVHTYYEAADLMVLSSAWEGFGNVLVEALAFGLPIVSSRCNFGPAEILADGEFGALVAVDDHSAMAEAMRRLLSHNPYEPKRQFERAMEFSERRIGEAYWRLISATTGGAA